MADESIESVAFPVAGEETILFGVKNLRVIRGPTHLIERAARYATAGADGTVLTAEEQELFDAVRAALTEAAPHEAPDETDQPITQIDIGNTLFCNLGCTYCYNELDTKDKKGSESPEGMPLETARQIVDAVVEQLGDEKSFSLVFIAGEALLEKEVLYWTVDYAKGEAARVGKILNVTVYTNGTLMDAKFLEWARANEIKLVLSLDGPPEVNDRHRKYLSGKGSSKIVLRNIRRLQEMRWEQIQTITAVTTEPLMLTPLAKYLVDLGFNDIQIQAAYGLDGFGDRGKVGDVVELMTWYRSLLLDGIVIGIAPFTTYLKRFTYRNGYVTNWYPCGVGRQALAVSPSGDIYPCNHFFDESEHKVGHIGDGIPAIDDRRHLFHRVDQREPCKSCWARHACGGECYHRAMTAGVGYSGVIEEVCEGKKSLIGLALELFADVAAHRPDSLRRLARKEYDRMPVVDRAYEVRDLSSYGAPSDARPRVYLQVVSF
jgi:uncharacterized protein